MCSVEKWENLYMVLFCFKIQLISDNVFGFYFIITDPDLNFEREKGEHSFHSVHFPRNQSMILQSVLSKFNAVKFATFYRKRSMCLSYENGRDMEVISY